MSKLRKNNLFAILAAAFVLMMAAASAHACECRERNTFELEFALAKAVFSGEVIELDRTQRDTVVTFRPSRVWKGEESRSIVVRTAQEKTACGFQFEKGRNYLVYAFGTPGDLRTSRCTRTVSAEHVSDDVKKLTDSGWSSTVNGLRARLHVLPSDLPDSPFCRVFIEMQNVSGVRGQRRIRFHPDRLSLQVTEIATGKPLPRANGTWSGGRPLWDTTLLPYAGSIKFQVSFPTLAYRRTDTNIIDMGPMKSWIIPPDGHFMLSGSLVIPAEKGDHPYKDWSGTIDMPMVRIPAPARASP